MSLKYLHVSECPTSLHSGMGRIQYNWNKEINERGNELYSIEPQQLGTLRHPLFFPLKARKYFRDLKYKANVIISHEPASGAFVGDRIPLFLVSHGIEARYWELSLKGKIPNPNVMSLKTRLLFPLWRLYNCNKGLKAAHKLLLSNEEDANYAQLKFGRKASDILVFRNGYYPESVPKLMDQISETPVILWNATWLDRKGKDTFLGALKLLRLNGVGFKCILAGTGYPDEEILAEVSSDLLPFLKVIRKFKSEEEKNLLAEADIFVLPSYFEGLPLSLIQALASGLCCVVSDNCGQKDIVINNENGLVFKTGNSEDLFNQLRKVIEDKTLRSKLSKTGADKMQTWDWKSVSTEVIDFIESNI